MFHRTSQAWHSAFSDYDFQYGTRTANLVAVGSFSVQPTSNHRFAWQLVSRKSLSDDQGLFGSVTSPHARLVNWSLANWTVTGIVMVYLSSGPSYLRTTSSAVRS